MARGRRVLDSINRMELRDVLGSSGRVIRTASSFFLKLFTLSLVGIGISSGVLRWLGRAL